MSRLLKSWIALAALALSTQALAWPYVNHIIASPATHRWVYLTAGWHYLRTQNLSPGADPVLHVWGPRYSGATYLGEGELGHDDNSGGGTDAFLWVYMPYANWTQVIVHAKSNVYEGTGDLVLDGSVIAAATSFAGNRLGAGGRLPAGYSYETALLHPPSIRRCRMRARAARPWTPSSAPTRRPCSPPTAARWRQPPKSPAFTAPTSTGCSGDTV